MKAGTGALLTCLEVFPRGIKAWTVFIYGFCSVKQSEASLAIDDIYGSSHMK